MEQHWYMGELIRSCLSARQGEEGERQHTGRWYWQTYHEQTGLPWSDEECPHYRTLAEAREAIKRWHMLQRAGRPARGRG